MQALRTTRPSAALNRAGAVKVYAVAKPVAAKRNVAAKSAAVATATSTEQLAKTVHLLTPANFNSFLEEHADKLVVVDFYTDWCGPCKMVAPELEKMANASDPSKVVYTKINCGATDESKRLAMSQEIRALPTFKLYKHGKVADQMTGAKVKVLQEMIEKHVA